MKKVILCTSFARSHSYRFEYRSDQYLKEQDKVKDLSDGVLRLSSSPAALSHDDPVAEKLQREAKVLLGASLDAVANGARGRLLEHPLTTALEAGTFAGVSYALTRLASSSGPFRYVAPVVSGALTLSFLKDMSDELPGRLGTIGRALKDTWNSAEKPELQEKRISSALGTLPFDFAFFSAAGLAGSSIAASGVERRTLERKMEEKFSARIDESVFKSRSVNPAGKPLQGTAFAVDSSRAGTAFHVVARDPASSWSLENGAGESLEAKVVAGHPLYDVAVLKVTEGETLKPLPLASEMLDGAKVEGAIVGAPGGGEVELRAARFKEGAVGVNLSYLTDNGIENAAGFLPAVKGGRAAPGMSGGPVLSENGEVIGVLNSISSGLPERFGLGTAAIPSPALSNLLAMLEEAEAPGAALTLRSASLASGIPESRLLSQLQSGVRRGFLVPGSASTVGNFWEWRVMKKP